MSSTKPLRVTQYDRFTVEVDKVGHMCRVTVRTEQGTLHVNLLKTELRYATPGNRLTMQWVDTSQWAHVLVKVSLFEALRIAAEELGDEITVFASDDDPYVMGVFTRNPFNETFLG